MIEFLIAILERNEDYAKRLVADLSEAQMAQQPEGAKGATNHPAWVLGHLAFVAEHYSGLLGGSPAYPVEWPAMFGMNSKPEFAGKYPAKADLMKALEAGHAKLKEVVRSKPADFWQQPPTDEKRRARFATNGVMAVHMLVNHEAVHLGQLSTWRRVQGLPSV